MEIYHLISGSNERKAREIIEKLAIRARWEAVGAEVRQVGSLRMGLMMKNLDADFHIYTDCLDMAVVQGLMEELARFPRVTKTEIIDGSQTDEHCISCYAWYDAGQDGLWKIDMINILRGSTYDGYFERMADGVCRLLTPATKDVILRLKYETPDEKKIPGVLYYAAVLRDGVRDYAEFTEWLEEHPLEGIFHWEPDKM